jgi:ubiquinone/menaquinone biosynthesis C-methylase UbiE
VSGSAHRPDAPAGPAAPPDLSASAETPPAFAADPATTAYYDQRAAEYDEWYRDTGLFVARQREGWGEAVAELTTMVGSLPPLRTLDVACGTGFLTRHLPGPVLAVDRSPAMVALARREMVADGARVAVVDALCLPIPSRSLDRVFTGHFYGHLPLVERHRFLSEAARVATELVVVDSALRPDIAAEGWQWRVLNDGSRHRVYKRYLTGPQLAEELGGEVLLDGEWFVAARAAL